MKTPTLEDYKAVKRQMIGDDISFAKKEITEAEYKRLLARPLSTRLQNYIKSKK